MSCDIRNFILKLRYTLSLFSSVPSFVWKGRGGRLTSNRLHGKNELAGVIIFVPQMKILHFVDTVALAMPVWYYLARCCKEVQR
jgi:hypothetical protein